jgi:hypothetical protein
MDRSNKLNKRKIFSGFNFFFWYLNDSAIEQVASGEENHINDE